jgi:tRNA1(Val) A37 N6-methylase TrmN6
MTKDTFTYQYSQPDEYHYSLDSIEFAEWVAGQIKSEKDPETFRVLDLCAGCGVIGFELSWHLKGLRNIHFMEIQDIYTNHFHNNVSKINRPELKFHWHRKNYEVLQQEVWKDKFDLIVSNPPYFQPEQGMLSSSDIKNRCRFFIDSTYHQYILSLANTLAAEGTAYFLQRPLDHHGSDLFAEAQNSLKNSGVIITKVAQIRACAVMELKK